MNGKSPNQTLLLHQQRYAAVIAFAVQQMVSVLKVFLNSSNLPLVKLFCQQNLRWLLQRFDMRFCVQTAQKRTEDLFFATSTNAKLLRRFVQIVSQYKAMSALIGKFIFAEFCLFHVGWFCLFFLCRFVCLNSKLKTEQISFSKYSICYAHGLLACMGQSHKILISIACSVLEAYIVFSFGFFFVVASHFYVSFFLKKALRNHPLINRLIQFALFFFAVSVNKRNDWIEHNVMSWVSRTFIRMQ